MWDMDINIFNFCGPILSTAISFLLIFLVGCGSQQTSEAPKQFPMTQNWELKPGDTIANYKILGGLGDISIALKGKKLYAPYNGRVQPHNSQCVVFSSEEVSAYLFRICGLQSTQFGSRLRGETMGRGEQVQIALLNKQADGKWAMVEPSKEIIEQMLQQH